MPGHDDDKDKDKDKHTDKPGKPGGAGRTMSTKDQLNAAAASMAALAADVDTINSTWVDPPQPDRPACIADCTAILQQAARITTLTNEFVTRLRR
jgi:hypothetical protein